MSEPGGNKYKNKKKRTKNRNKRFMQNAKGFAKQGIHGRGTHIDDDQYIYFINILNKIKTGFEDTEEKVTMATNVFEEVSGQEVTLASNQIVCKVFEALIGYVEAPQLEEFIEEFTDNFRPICSDPYASHVLQKLVEITFLRGMGNERLKEAKSNDGPSEEKKMKTDNVKNEVEYNLEKEFSDEHRENCRQFVLRVSKFLLNNLEDFVWDLYANHIMRACIYYLGGIFVPKVAFQKKNVDVIGVRDIYRVPDEWTEVLIEYPQRLEMWPQFKNFPNECPTSAFLGAICIALQSADRHYMKKFVKTILLKCLYTDEEDAEGEEEKDDSSDGDEGKEKKNVDRTKGNEDEGKEDVPLTKGNNGEDKKDVPLTKSGEDEDFKDYSNTSHLPKAFHLESSIRLMETLISIGGKKIAKEFYSKLFAKDIVDMAKTPATNFSVQRLIKNINEQEVFEEIFSKLYDHIEEIINIGHTGVVLSLAETALNLETKQAQLISGLQSAFHVAGDKEKLQHFIICLLKMRPYDVALLNEMNFVHLHGSLILQHIFNYKKPIFAVKCLLDMSAVMLVQIFNMPNGSYIVDAFVTSKTIGEKSREKLIRLLDGFYVDLAKTRPGSRVVEKCFEVAQEGQKMRIAKELADKMNMVKSTTYGRIVCQKLRIETFKLSPAQWQASSTIQTKNKAKRLFKDIIN